MGIRYRCTACWKRHQASRDEAGQTVQCKCGARLRVPENDGDARVQHGLFQRIFIFLVWGLAGAILISFPSFVLLRMMASPKFPYIYGSILLVGFLLGAFGRDRFIDWFGKAVREMFNHPRR